MPELNLVDTQAAGGAVGRIRSPYLMTDTSGAGYGDTAGNGYLEYGTGTPGSLPFRVDQAGNVTANALSISSVSSQASLNIAPSGDHSGVTDYTAIQAAINALGALGGGAILLNPGEIYYISQPLIIDFSKITIQGGGFGFNATIACAFTASQTAMIICGTSMSTVRSYINLIGLTVQGNSNANSGHGILYRVEIGVIRDVVVQFVAGDGIHMSPNDLGLGPYDTNMLDNVYIQFPGGAGIWTDSQVTSSEWWGVHVNGGALKGTSYSSVTATNASPCVFTVSGSAPANNTPVTLQGGSIPTGFSASNSGTVYFVVSSSGSTFELASTVGGAAINSTGTGSGMTVQQVVYTAGTGAGVGFYLQGGNIKLYGCHPFECVSFGLQAVAARNLHIIGGEYESNNQAGINFSNSVRCAVTQGDFYCAPNPTVPLQHVLINSTSNYITLKQCSFHLNNYSPNAGVEVNFSTEILVDGCTFQDSGMSHAILVDSGNNASYSSFINNQINIASGAAITLGNSTHCNVSGNRMISNSTIQETAAGSADYNTYHSNDLTSGGTISLVGAHSRAAFNPGYNPVGKIGSPPGVPSSGAAGTINSTGVDCMVVLTVSASGGATQLYVGGQATGIAGSTASSTLAPVRVPAGQTVGATYTNTPVWNWFGD